MGRKVAIVDDEQSVLNALSRGLELTGDIICTGLHHNAAEALQAIPQSPPDVVLMDVNMPGMTGIECTCRLKAVLPDLPVIMFTGSADRFILFQSLMAGASGYLVKPCSAEECRAAIHEVAAGGAPLSRAMARALVQSFHSATPGKGTFTDLLSPREREIMACLFQGCSDKEISSLLGIGMATVHTHMHRMFGKLGVSNRQEATGKYLGACNRTVNSQ